jgi:hypothetical protein
MSEQLLLLQRERGFVQKGTSFDSAPRVAPRSRSKFPKTFFNAMCSAISAAKTSLLVCTFFSRNSIRSCFSSARRPGTFPRLEGGRSFLGELLLPAEEHCWLQAPVPRTDRKPERCPNDGAVKSPPSLQPHSACALFAYVRSAILTDERFLHSNCGGTVRFSGASLTEGD